MGTFHQQSFLIKLKYLDNQIYYKRDVMVAEFCRRTALIGEKIGTLRNEFKKTSTLVVFLS